MALRFLSLTFLLLFIFSSQMALSDHSPSPSPSPSYSPPSPSPNNDESPSPSPAPIIYSPPSDLTPTPSPSNGEHDKKPSPSPSPPKIEGDINHSDNLEAADSDSSSGNKMKGGQKAGVAIGVIAGACVVGVGALVYKKRQNNIRRSEYSYAARRDFL